VSEPDAYNAIRRVLLNETSVTTLLLPQASLTGLTEGAPIFAYEYPRKKVGAAATVYIGHDWAALLKALSVKLLLVSPSGRVPSGGDTSRALWSRPRFDLLSFAPTKSQAMQVLLTAEKYLKALSRVRATLTGGAALVHDVTIEGGPINFVDPDVACPVVVGIYAASIAEEWVA
jgi:hypothetical protein